MKPPCKSAGKGAERTRTAVAVKPSISGGNEGKIEPANHFPGSKAPSPLWHLRSRAINEIVRAEDQFAAWDALRELPAQNFGLIVVAEKDEDADPIPVHTSALMTWWGRHDEAQLFRQVAVDNGPPDTTESDRAFAEARR